MGGTVSNMMQPSLNSFGQQMNQQAFNNQLGRASNQMYQPPNQMGGYDPYTAMRRPNYMPFGPNQQFYQPIYQPSYSQFSNFGYGQAPFGGFYQPPMMGRQMMGRGLQGGQQLGTANPDMFTNYGDFDPRFRPQQSNPQQSNMVGGQATYLTDQFQPMMPPQQAQTQYQSTPYTAPQQSRNPFKRGFAAAFGGQQPQSNFPYSVNYGQPMLTPQPMQTQYRPIPFMNQTQVDARDAAAAAAAAPPPSYDGGGGFKKGGKVDDDGIASLLKK
jgi:hypothetical protein